MNRKQKRNSTRTSSTQQDIGKGYWRISYHLTGKTARIEKRNRCKINKTFSLEFLLNTTLFSAQTGGI